MREVTLTQLSAFVLVARLGSVKDAAAALGVSEPAVSQALAALRRHFGDPLLVRGAHGMVLTAAGQRLAPVAAQMVGLGEEAEAAVRSARGAAERLRLVAAHEVVEFVAGPLAAAMANRPAGAVELTTGVAGAADTAVLVAQRLADAALGPDLTGAEPGLVSEPVLRCRLVVLAAPGTAVRGGPARWPWLVGPGGTDPDGDVGRLLRDLGVPEERLSVFPNQRAAWDAAVRGDGVAPALAHLAVHELRRRELQVVEVPGTPRELYWHLTTLTPEQRPPAAGALRRFLATPDAMRLVRAPGAGVPRSRYRPSVHVTIWN
jgi:LysR family transcriptional regulator, low CO2-responsive transcriptional regulator